MSLVLIVGCAIMCRVTRKTTLGQTKVAFIYHRFRHQGPEPRKILNPETDLTAPVTKEIAVFSILCLRSVVECFK